MISLIDKFNQVSMLDMPDSIAKIYKDVPEINEIDNRGFPICRPLFSHSSLPFNFELEQVDVNNTIVVSLCIVFMYTIIKNFGLNT